MTDYDPARLAALDQELADLGARLDRNHRRVVLSDAGLLCAAIVAIVYFLAARPSVSHWAAVVPWGILVLVSAGNLFQGRMLRNYRAEIRDLRARVR